MLNHLLSIILGIIFGIILHRIFVPVTLHGPNSTYIRNQIYQNKNKCFKLEPIIKICPFNNAVKKK